MANASVDDVQRLFLQSVLSRGMMSEKLAMTVWGKCKEAVKAANDDLDISENNSKASFDVFRGQINTALDKLELEFTSMHDQVTGRSMYAMLNRKGDAIAQMATDYTPLEIAFFKAIVEQIMWAPDESYSVSSMSALREVANLKSNMTKTQAEIVLGSFVAKGWLVRSQRGRYSISTRTVHEMAKYLKDVYNDGEDLPECTVCSETVTLGVGCGTANCKGLLHNHCYKRLRINSVKCPTCQQEWPEDPDGKRLRYIGEGAAKDGAGDRQRRVRRKGTPDGSDNDEMFEEDEEPSQPTRIHKKAKASAANMEVEEDNTPPLPTSGRRKSGR